MRSLRRSSGAWSPGSVAPLPDCERQNQRPFVSLCDAAAGTPSLLFPRDVSRLSVCQRQMRSVKEGQTAVSWCLSGRINSPKKDNLLRGTAAVSASPGVAAEPGADQTQPTGTRVGTHGFHRLIFVPCETLSH